MNTVQAGYWFWCVFGDHDSCGRSSAFLVGQSWREGSAEHQTVPGGVDKELCSHGLQVTSVDCLEQASLVSGLCRSHTRLRLRALPRATQACSGPPYHHQAAPPLSFAYNTLRRHQHTIPIATVLSLLHTRHHATAPKIK